MFFKDAIPVTEPLWGKNIMIALNDRMIKHDLLVWLVPYTADIFVFTYPIYLVALYLYGIGKRNSYYKEAALGIAFSAAGAAVVNFVIQFFGDKSRPEESIENSANLLLSHLPTDPFPSDHAAVSAAIAMATLLWGLKHNDKMFLRLSWFFWLACIIMSVSRVMVAIHWPTDILVGIAIGVIVACIVFSKRVWIWLKHVAILPLIKFEKWLFKKVFKIDQD